MRVLRLIALAVVALLAKPSLPAVANQLRPAFIRTAGSPMTFGKGAGRVVLVDVNRDGHLDLITQHQQQQEVRVSIGDGKGGFTPLNRATMRFQDAPSLAVADINRDGAPDVAVAFRDEKHESVELFFGTATGEFRKALRTPITVAPPLDSYGPPALRFLDINKDGAMDLVSCNARRNTIEVLDGDGRGGFGTPRRVMLDKGYSYYSSAFGDLDGDGHLDLVVAMSPASSGERGRLVTRRGDGNGAFAAPSGEALVLRPNPRVAAVTDFNGDGRADVVLSHSELKFLSLLFNQGQGRLGPVAVAIDLPAPAFGVLDADVNGDGTRDIVAATVHSDGKPYDSGVAVFLGIGGGQLVPASGSPFPAEEGAFNVAAGDINGDGRLDLAASSFGGKGVTVLLGQ